jgi:hypothetical protein
MLSAGRMPFRPQDAILAHIALLAVKQASISKMESRTDMSVGTLARAIKAMRGELEIRARFPMALSASPDSPIPADSCNST